MQRAPRNAPAISCCIYLQKVIPDWIRACLCLLLLLRNSVRLVFGCRVENVEVSFSSWGNLEDAGQITATVTVIRGTPNSRQAIIKHDHVPLIAELMCAQNVRHGVDLEELLHDLRAKCISSSSWTKRKLISVAVWIAPYQIGHWPFVGNLSEAVDNFDLVYAVYARAESSVNAEDLVINDARQGKVVEHVGEMVPYSCVAIFSTALCVEAV